MTLTEDVRKLQQAVEQLSAAAETNRVNINRHEEQINGKTGFYRSIEELTAEVRSLRKGAYWVGGLIIAGSLSFAFGVLALLG